MQHIHAYCLSSTSKYINTCVFLLECLCVLPDVSVLAVRGYTRTIWTWAGMTKVTKERVNA